MLVISKFNPLQFFYWIEFSLLFKVVLCWEKTNMAQYRGLNGVRGNPLSGPIQVSTRSNGDIQALGRMMRNTSVF